MSLTYWYGAFIYALRNAPGRGRMTWSSGSSVSHATAVIFLSAMRLVMVAFYVYQIIKGVQCWVIVTQLKYFVLQILYFKMSDFIGRFEFLMDHNYAASSSDNYEENMEDRDIIQLVENNFGTF